MKTRRLFVGISALVFALVPAGCDVSDHDGVFELKLRGTWETYEPSDGGYSGKLVIGRDTITISGYGQSGLDEGQRPFKGIRKNVSLEGYSEDGKIYIYDSGWEGIAYEYKAGVYPLYVNLLQFTFKGRNEKLWKGK